MDTYSIKKHLSVQTRSLLLSYCQCDPNPILNYHNNKTRLNSIKLKKKFIAQVRNNKKDMDTILTELPS